MTNYNVTFSIDGSLMVEADSPDAAERMALDAIEGMDLYDADDTTVDGCSVRVAFEFTYENDDPDECVKLERPPRVVEFA